MRKELSIVRYEPDIDKGLDVNQIQERKTNKLTNKVKNTSEKSYLKIVFDNVFTFFNIMMIGLAVLLVAVVGPKIITNLFFLVILLCNTIIGTYQECKCKHTLKKLKLLYTSKIQVLRDGREEQVLPSDILLDDIVILFPGDQVPVDCLIKSDGIYEVNESLMTGESCSIKKKQGDLLLAGSCIISGKIYAKADKVGKDTYLYSLESKARGFKKPKSKLIGALNRIIKLLIGIAIPLGLIVGWQELVKNGTESAIKWGSLAITYMVPAGMILLATIAMMIAVVKLANKKTLTQDIYSVEALSRIDTLCLDKTGTLTDGTMTVEKVIYYNKDLEKNGIISSYLSAFDTDNQTSRALVEKFSNKRVYDVKNTIPFSSERKFSAVEFEKEGTWILGAPEYLTNNETILKLVDEYTSNGLRVVVLTKTTQKIAKINKVINSTKQVMAMFVLRDNIRKGVVDTLNWFAENDVDVRVISGDNVKTVSYIAKQCGVRNWDKYIDLSTITDKQAFKQAVLTHWVYGRVNPDQKAEIVDILREQGRIVGMTGDGVNDVISLKKADCSIALGTGAPATKNISNFILLDNDFNHMKDAVLQGRGVVNNVQRSCSLFIMKNILWMIMMIVPILFGVSHIYEATVISIVNGFITGLGSVCLTIEPSSERIQGDFYKTVLYKATVAGIYMSLPILAIHIYSFIACGVNIPNVELLISNMLPVASLCIAIAGFVIFYHICKPFTKYRKFIYSSVLILTLLVLFAIPDFFLINGTEHLQELINYGSVGAALEAIIKNMFSLNIYKMFTLREWIIIGVFLTFSSSLYILTNKLVDRFNRRRELKQKDDFETLGGLIEKIKSKIKHDK